MGNRGPHIPEPPPGRLDRDGIVEAFAHRMMYSVAKDGHTARDFDVYQALAYAAVLGLPTAGLVYPGRRFTAHTYTAPGSTIRLQVVRLRLVGRAAQRDRSLSRLARLVQQF